MSKFVVGDLVTLSSAGKKNQHNHTVKDLIGIVTNTNHNDNYPYQIKWIGLPQSGDQLPMKEYEIKFVKNGGVP